VTSGARLNLPETAATVKSIYLYQRSLARKRVYKIMEVRGHAVTPNHFDNLGAKKKCDNRVPRR
jgi:hypothetical protein